MLRITTVADSPTDVMLKLEGRVASEWVVELETECRRWMERRPRVRLEFSDVTFVDRHGARLLAALCGSVVEIVNCPPLIRELLAAIPG